MWLCPDGNSIGKRRLGHFTRTNAKAMPIGSFVNIYYESINYKVARYDAHGKLRAIWRTPTVAIFCGIRKMQIDQTQKNAASGLWGTGAALF